MPLPTPARCQRCGQHPATVLLTDVVNKVRRTRQICEACARSHQLLPTPDDAAQPLNLPALVQLVFGDPPAAAAADPDEALTCPDCGRTYAEFRAEGRAGCAADYDAFVGPLLPLLERIHRQTEYLGKTPRRHRAAPPAPAALPALRDDLRAAVAAEDYGRAAALRDTIRSLEGPG